MGTATRVLLTGILAATLVVSSVSVVEAATRWEYKVLELKSMNVVGAQQLELLLNQLGVDGWALVEISAAGVAVLKREK